MQWSIHDITIEIVSCGGWRTGTVSGVIEFESEDLRTRSPMSEGRRWTSWLKQREWIHPSSAFCSALGLNWLDTAHPHWWSLFSLLSLQIQMLIASRTTLTDTPRNSFSPDIWASLGPVKSMCKINHPRGIVLVQARFTGTTVEIGLHSESYQPPQLRVWDPFHNLLFMWLPRTVWTCKW